MEYIVALLILVLIVVMYIQKPNMIYNAVIDSLLESLQRREGEIVYGLYNKLPQHIKDKVDSKVIAEIVGFTIGIITDVLGKNIK